MNGAAGIRDFAVEQMNHLLTGLAFQVHRAAASPDPEQVHDLRVSIRRFSQGLLLFSDFFPDWEIKKIKRMLKRMMRLTSEIRDRDIALEFLAKHKHAGHRQRLERDRVNRQRELSQMVRRWNARDFSAKWRNRLSLRGL